MEKFTDCCTVDPLRLVICAECQALTTMGIVSKSWLVRGASHILTTHTKTHKPLYPSQRDQTTQQRPFKGMVCTWVCEFLTGMFVCNRLGGGRDYSCRHSHSSCTNSRPSDKSVFILLFPLLGLSRVWWWRLSMCAKASPAVPHQLPLPAVVPCLTGQNLSSCA